MTLNQILYFQKVARLENYHQAAEELYISQPSLSRSMAVLESELGVALFEKKGRGVTLTKAGQLFLEHLRRHPHHHRAHPAQRRLLQAPAAGHFCSRRHRPPDRGRKILV